jgi:hypothetical protein
MKSTHSSQPAVQKPACPECGSREKVIRMASSLTPFERPQMQAETGGHWFCQACAHDFEPEVEEE